MATACSIAFFMVGGWLVPINPFFFHSSTSVLILLLMTNWLDPFLSGMIFLLSAESIGRAFHQSRRCTRIEIRPVSTFKYSPSTQLPVARSDRQAISCPAEAISRLSTTLIQYRRWGNNPIACCGACLLYTSDAADE